VLLLAVYAFYKSNYCKEYGKYFDSDTLHKEGIS